MQALFEIMVQIKQKRSIGVENLSARSFSVGFVSRVLGEYMCSQTRDCLRSARLFASFVSRVFENICVLCAFQGLQKICEYSLWEELRSARLYVSFVLRALENMCVLPVKGFRVCTSCENICVLCFKGS